MPTNRATELAGLGDVELNELAAKCLGWKEEDFKWIAHLKSALWCASYDAVHRDLLPEIERRGLWGVFQLHLHKSVGPGPETYGWLRSALTATPKQLTACFVAVMEQANA